MSAKNPNNRISAKEALNHPLFKKKEEISIYSSNITKPKKLKLDLNKLQQPFINYKGKTNRMLMRQYSDKHPNRSEDRILEVELYSNKKKKIKHIKNNIKRFGSVEYSNKKINTKGLSILLKNRNNYVRDISEKVRRENSINLNEIKLFKDKIKMIKKNVQNISPDKNNLKHLKKRKKNYINDHKIHKKKFIPKNIKFFKSGEWVKNNKNSKLSLNRTQRSMTKKTARPASVNPPQEQSILLNSINFRKSNNSKPNKYNIKSSKSIPKKNSNANPQSQKSKNLIKSKFSLSKLKKTLKFKKPNLKSRTSKKISLSLLSKRDPKNQTSNKFTRLTKPKNYSKNSLFIKSSSQKINLKEFLTQSKHIMNPKKNLKLNFFNNKFKSNEIKNNCDSSLKLTKRKLVNVNNWKKKINHLKNKTSYNLIPSKIPLKNIKLNSKSISIKNTSCRNEKNFFSNNDQINIALNSHIFTSNIPSKTTLMNFTERIPKKAKSKDQLITDILIKSILYNKDYQRTRK